MVHEPELYFALRDEAYVRLGPAKCRGTGVKSSFLPNVDVTAGRWRRGSDEGRVTICKPAIG